MSYRAIYSAKYINIESENKRNGGIHVAKIISNIEISSSSNDKADNFKRNAWHLEKYQ